jgi:hypothetical protein
MAVATPPEKTREPAPAVQPEPRSASKYFELRHSPIQGWGGFATRTIRKGTRIIEYLGERITSEESDRRYDDEKMERHHTFLFALDSGWIIDASVNGNEARFLNHSCDPNCEAVEEDDRIFIESKRTIHAGEELVYDYAYAREDVENIKDAERLYVCRCGTAKCRGTILAPPKKKRKKRAQGAKPTRSKRTTKPKNSRKPTRASKTGRTGTKAGAKKKTGRRAPRRSRG